MLKNEWIVLLILVFIKNLKGVFYDEMWFDKWL